MPRYAAIDIGSNSIRMQAAEVLPGETRVLAAERQVTRLGESVFRQGAVSDQAMTFACSVLQKMAAEYRKVDVVGVRAVATAAVRDARNQEEFVARASEAAGAPVEIITGREESRLIHLGVQSRWPQDGKRVLIVDIGGGSAEMIVGDDGHMRDAVSKPLGAVRLHEIFLASDPAAEGELRHMLEYIDERISGTAHRFGVQRWDRAIATSATASAIVCAINRIPRSKRDEADRRRAATAQVRAFYRRLAGMSVAERRKVTGIGPSRAEIIVPGAAVLLRVLEEFNLPSVYFSTAGVRDGIIADLAARGVGRELAELSRDQRREVEHLAVKYGVSLKHVRKVAQMARALFADLQPLHKLAPGFGRLLEAAAFLHDIGHFVNDSAHHKHAYYLVSNSDLPGFTARERELVANLCRYHRKTMPTTTHGHFQVLSAEEKRTVQLLSPLLRLADALDRRHEQRVADVEGRISDGRVTLRMAGDGDIDLEQWAAARAGETFREVYGLPLDVERRRA